MPTMKFWLYAFAIVGTTFMLFSSCEKDDDDNNGLTKTVTDIDGNVYKTVKIGDQVWFTENLKTTQYNDGTPIPNVTGNSDWSILTSGAYAWYNNDEATYKDAYGALYNWYAVATGTLCPMGWRVPTDADWTSLTDYAGGLTVAGGKLKSTRTIPDDHPRWESPNTGATDEYNFSALPDGRRSSSSGSFLNAGSHSYWWSSTEDSFYNSWYRLLYYDRESVGRYYVGKRDGFSVRCVMDN